MSMLNIFDKTLFQSYTINEEEKKQEQLNMLKYIMPLVIVAAIIFVFILSTIFMGNSLK